MSRTRKRAYTKSKRFDASCRNHGSCSYCREGRLFKYKKKRQKAEDEIKDYWRGQ